MRAAYVELLTSVRGAAAGYPARPPAIPLHALLARPALPLRALFARPALPLPSAAADGPPAPPDCEQFYIRTERQPARLVIHSPRHRVPRGAAQRDRSCVNNPALLRASRRHAGISQRELAHLVDMSPAAVAAWESGSRKPSVMALQRILDAVGLDLHLGPGGAGPPSPELRAHLRLPLTSRLRLALGEPASPYVRATGSAWLGLVRLGRLGSVVLQPPVALGLWVPQPARQLVDVTVHGQLAPLPPQESVNVAVSADGAPASVVSVTVDGPVRVWVKPPAELVADQTCGLRQAAALLDALGALDDAGRRRPAHRDPDEWAEGWRLLLTRGTEGLRQPRGELSRAWRLGAPASLAQSVRHPPR